MTKKTYQQPEVAVVEMGRGQVICTSGDLEFNRGDADDDEPWTGGFD